MRFRMGIIKLAVLGVLVLVMAGAALLWWTGRPGTTRLERWIGRHLQAIISAHLNAELAFDDLDYQYPRTVLVAHFRLTADDPDHPGQRVDVIRAEAVRLELAEVPREGRPVRITQLILHRPQIRVISRGEQDPRFVGLSNLLKEPDERRPEKIAREVRLSEVFHIRLLQLIDGEVVYEPRQEEALPPMRLDGIDARLDVEAADGGWYKLSGELRREPLMSLAADGRLNLDEMLLQVERLALSARLDREQDRYLPPQLQRLLIEHEVTGDLKFEGQGTIPLSDAAAAEFAATFALTDAHFAAGEYRGQADFIRGELDISERRLSLRRLTARTLGGEIGGRGEVELDEAGRMDVHLTASGLRVEETLRSAGGGAGEPKYRGILTGSVHFGGPLDDLGGQADGSGSVQLHAGKVTGMPVFAALNRALLTVLGGVGGDGRDDLADLQFVFAGDHVTISRLEAHTAAYFLRGDGQVRFDGRLDLRLAVSPLGHVRRRLGIIGDVLGGVTEQVITYRVTGRLGEPDVRLEPLGGLGRLLEGVGR